MPLCRRRQATQSCAAVVVIGGLGRHFDSYLGSACYTLRYPQKLAVGLDGVHFFWALRCQFVFVTGTFLCLTVSPPDVWCCQYRGTKTCRKNPQESAGPSLLLLRVTHALRELRPKPLKSFRRASGEVALPLHGTYEKSIFLSP